MSFKKKPPGRTAKKSSKRSEPWEKANGADCKSAGSVVDFPNVGRGTLFQRGLNVAAEEKKNRHQKHGNPRKVTRL
jgi:hypothetical protein